jgi:hypothetical protein
VSAKKTNSTILSRANAALRKRLYSEAIELYELALKEHPELVDAIAFNIDLAVGRISTTSLNPEGSPTSISEGEKSVLNTRCLDSIKPNLAPTLAVVVHLYYIHLWPQISKYLLNLKHSFRLVITHPQQHTSQIRDIVGLDYPNASYLPTDNIGMDVMPFIKAVKAFELWNYDAVLKLHTKNDKTEDKQIQGAMLLDGVLCSERSINNILELLKENSKVGIVGPELLFRSGERLMYNNRNKFEKIMSALKQSVDGSSFGFIAGTTFWMRGSLLKPFDLNYQNIEELFSDDISATTGGDGTYAHAMERAFGAIVISLGYDAAVSYPSGLEPLQYDVKVVNHRLVNLNPIYQTGSGAHVIRYKHLHAIANSIRKSPHFDATYYISQLPPGTIATTDPVIHYILNGELFTASPSSSFNDQYYITRYKDISRTRSPALIHYINHGSREKRNAAPTDCDWIALGIKEGLIKDKWSNRESELAVILKHGTPEQCADAYTKNYDPYLIPKLAFVTKKHTAIESLKTYLMVIFQEEFREYDLLERVWSNSDYKNAIILAQAAIANYGDTRVSLEVLAAAQLLMGYWSDARATFSQYWKSFKVENTLVERVKKSVLRIDQPTHENDDFKIIREMSTTSIEPNIKVCVYTTLFGDIDDLLPVISESTSVDFICFTDTDREPRGWQMRVVTPSHASMNLSAKIYKILPHQHLSEYTHSLFVDANTLFLGRLDRIISLCLTGGDFVMWRHPMRRDIYKECVAIITSKRHEPISVIQQLKKYHAEGFPRDTGLTEGSFIWRSHASTKISNFMDSWWKEILNGSARDQVSLGYLMWATKVRPTVFPESLGTSRDNIFFAKVPHNFETNKPERKPNIRAKKRDITFIYSDLHKDSGSTVMRGSQLSTLLRPHFLKERAISYKSADKIVKNSVIFLTKGALKAASIEWLQRLKELKNTVLADFVDDIPDPSKLPYIDMLVASSISGYKHYMTNLSHIPTALLTHHVDPRVHKIAGSNKTAKHRCAVGYFGELVNTKWSSLISEHVEFHGVDTSKQNAEWISKVPSYNCHYAVRERRSIDGFKPFLKGFTAATADSNIIIQRNEGDAAYYLGDDYPFLLDTNAGEAEILEMITNVTQSFGSPEWRYGLDIMTEVKERSSNAAIVREFKSLLKEIDQ